MARLEDGPRAWTVAVTAESVAACQEYARCLDLAAMNGGHVTRELRSLAAQLVQEAADGPHARTAAALHPDHQQRLTRLIAQLAAGLHRHVDS